MDSLIVFLAAYLIYAIVLITLYAWHKSGNRSEFAAAVFLAGFFALFLSALASLIYSHPRPFVTLNIDPLIAHGADNAFPSQHTILAMTLTSIIYFYWRKLAAAALALTLLVGAGRVWADVHWWVDIAGGLAVGAAAGFLGVKLAKLLLKSSRLNIAKKKS